MSVIQIDRNPERKKLNQFGWVWLGFLVFFGLLAWFKWENQTVAKVLWTLSVVIPVIGWIFPAFMRLVFLGLTYAVWPIGFVVSHLILAAVFYLIFTPIGLLVRLIGHDPMRRKLEPDAETYWIKRPDGEPEVKSYFRQF
ncbi:MAG: SxtJ family membrane protein [Verrucomicrobiota bacterium]